MMNNSEIKDEILRDEASRFSAEKYVSNGYYLHFHRNLEIYGVLRGKVLVTIAGRSQTLTDGQIAIIDGLENHSYEIAGEAEVFFFHIGTRYVGNLYNMYPRKRLPYWLMDVEYNRILLEQIWPLLNSKQLIPEMKRIGIVCSLFSDIIEHYGVTDKSVDVSGDDIVTEVVQYIYDHYNENITLETLSKVFYLSPKALSKKMKKRLSVDLRVFINDIRVQRAVHMRDDPKNRGMTLYEIATQCGFTNMGTFYRSYERNFKLRKMEEQNRQG